jgi:hypothetical protein
MGEIRRETILMTVGIIVVIAGAAILIVLAWFAADPFVAGAAAWGCGAATATYAAAWGAIKKLKARIETLEAQLESR